MTTTLVLIAASLAALVLSATGCPPDDQTISNCCSLGFNTILTLIGRNLEYMLSLTSVDISVLKYTDTVIP